MAREQASAGSSPICASRFDDDFYIGPGRADLLEVHRRDRLHLSAAGKRMGMSYKRAWSLVQALNDGYGAPLVETSRGGSGQGGASLTLTARPFSRTIAPCRTRPAGRSPAMIAAVEKRRDLSRRK